MLKDLPKAYISSQLQSKQCSKRIDKIEEKPALPPCQHKADFERFEKLEEEVKHLKEEPAKKWDKLITSVITSLSGGIIGYILAVILR